MFRNHLIQPGTFIGYDDMWVLPCANDIGPLTVGEGK
jgi:hypothetical protein